MSELPLRLRDVLSRLDVGLRALYQARYRGLVLYGSYARGTARPESDVDLLLLLDGPVDACEEVFRAEEVAWPIALESGYLLAIVPVDVDRYHHDDAAFLHQARRHGVMAA